MSDEEETDDRYLAYRRSRPLVRINILVPMSSRASSLGDDSRVTMGQANNASHTDRRDGSGSVCVNRGASHRLIRSGQRIIGMSTRVRTKSNAAVLGQDLLNA
jgi:hypothetical protein